MLNEIINIDAVGLGGICALRALCHMIKRSVIIEELATVTRCTHKMPQRQSIHVLAFKALKSHCRGMQDNG